MCLRKMRNLMNTTISFDVFQVLYVFEKMRNLMNTTISFDVFQVLYVFEKNEKLNEYNDCVTNIDAVKNVNI